MARSRRPELEKDNPAAPQMYSRRKRRQAPDHGVLPSRSDEQSPLGEALLALTEAAERFMNGVPRSKRVDSERQMLLDAITQAQLVLSSERIPGKRSAHR